MNEEREYELLNQWLNGDIDDEALRQSIPNEEILKYRQILDTVDQLVPDHDEMIFDPTEITHQAKVVAMKPGKWQYLSVAASVLVIVSLGIFFFGKPSNVSHQTAFGDQLELVLPDQTTQLTLSAKSEVTWSSKDWESGQRVIKLNGKGYLDVSQKGEFKVNTELGLVEVLGTRFEVSTQQKSMLVICYEGVVRASVKSENVLLRAGQMARYHDEAWEEVTQVTDNAPSWLRDLLTFKNAPLSEVLAELTAQFDLEIRSGDIDLNRRFSGTLPDDNLDLALKAVFVPLDISYELEDKTLILFE